MSSNTTRLMRLWRNAAVMASFAVFVLVFIGVAAPGRASAVSDEPLPDVEAIPATTFVDSIGVNIHLTYGDTAYADFDRTLAALQQLGVRHVRDGIVADRADQAARAQELRRHGIGIMWITGSPADKATADQRLASLEGGPLAGTATGIEATNEWDLSGRTTWVEETREWYRFISQRAAASDRLGTLPLLGPSFGTTHGPQAFGALAPDGVVANMHPYPGGEAPEVRGEMELARVRHASGANQVYATETGYHNARSATAGHRAASERAAGHYMPRLLLSYARMGVARTYLYELWDEKPDPSMGDIEQHFGLLRNDGTPKPAFNSVRNLISDLGSGAVPPASPQRLRYRIRGGGAALRQMLLADGHGGFTIAMWRVDSLEDTVSGEERPAQSAIVRLELDTDWVATVRRPSGDNISRLLGVDGTFDLDASGVVTLVKLTRPVDDRRGQTPEGGSRLVIVRDATSGFPDQAATLASALDPTDPGSCWTGSDVERETADVPPGFAAAARISGSNATCSITFPTGDAWTIELWARTDPQSGSFAEFARGLGGDAVLMRTYDVTSSAAHHQQLSAYGGSWSSEVHGQAQVGTWHHLALSSNGSRVRFLVDGQAVAGAERGTASTVPARLTGVRVGSSGGAFRGALTGLVVTDRALTDQELVLRSSADRAAMQQPLPAGTLGATAGEPAPTPTSPAPPGPDVTPWTDGFRGDDNGRQATGVLVSAGTNRGTYASPTAVEPVRGPIALAPASIASTGTMWRGDASNVAPVDAAGRLMAGSWCWSIGPTAATDPARRDVQAILRGTAPGAPPTRVPTGRWFVSIRMGETGACKGPRVIRRLLIDRTTPTLRLTRASSTTAGRIVWTSLDQGSGVAGHQIQQRLAFAGDDRSPSVRTVRMGPSAQSAYAPAVGSARTCVRVRALDRAGNSSAWTPWRCRVASSRGG